MNYSHCPFFGEEGRCLDGSYFSDVSRYEEARISPSLFFYLFFTIQRMTFAKMSHKIKLHTDT